MEKMCKVIGINWDGDVRKSFFKTLKVECLYGYDFETWSNILRRHSAIEYMSSEEFEGLVLNSKNGRLALTFDYFLVASQLLSNEEEEGGY